MKKKLAKATAGEKKAVMKALLDRTLLVITAFAAVSVAGAGFYYVSSASEPPRRVAEEDAPGQHMKLQNPTVAKNPTVVLSQLAPTKRRLKTKILAD